MDRTTQNPEEQITMDKSTGAYFVYFGNAVIGTILLSHYLIYCEFGVSLFPVVHVLWFFLISPTVFIFHLIILVVMKIRGKTVINDHLIGLGLVLLVNAIY